MAEQAKQAVFTDEMKKDYTILIPDMLPIHFSLLKDLFTSYGYNIEILKTQGRSVVDEGLKHVHNDTCYPALLVIGQMIDALKSGKYDLNKTALMITQTGGGCRASNYIHLLRKALVKAGFADIPVLSLNFANLEGNNSLKFTKMMILKALAIIAYGDILMLLHNQVKPYEVIKGESAKLVDKWVRDLGDAIRNNRGFTFRKVRVNLAKIAASFAQIKVEYSRKIKVGIVGEIYVKYSALGNNNLEKFLYEQGCEVMVPGLMSFVLYNIDTHLEDIRLYGGRRIKAFIVRQIMYYVMRFEDAIITAVSRYKDFVVPKSFWKLKALAQEVIGIGCKMGEGWLLTGEMMELASHGYENIVCAQPFGCLPNHIVGKGMIRKVRELNPNANIVPIDYDPGATRVNQENRIKLMLAVAAETLQKRQPCEQTFAPASRAV